MIILEQPFLYFQGHARKRTYSLSFICAGCLPQGIRLISMGISRWRRYIPFLMGVAPTQNCAKRKALISCLNYFTNVCGNVSFLSLPRIVLVTAKNHWELVQFRQISPPYVPAFWMWQGLGGQWFTMIQKRKKSKTKNLSCSTGIFFLFFFRFKFIIAAPVCL